MKKTSIYIASPYTHGWQAQNVKRQLEARHILMDLGYVPFVPLENHFAEIFNHREEKDWIAWDLYWLKKCDILIHIKAYYNDGSQIPSEGVEIELKTARDSSIPIYEFDSLELMEHFFKYEFKI